LPIDIWTVTTVKETLNSLEFSDIELGLLAGDGPIARAIICIFSVSKTVAIVIDLIVTYFGLPFAWYARLYTVHALA